MNRGIVRGSKRMEALGAISGDGIFVDAPQLPGTASGFSLASDTV